MSPPTPPPLPAWVLAEWETSAKRKRAARDGALPAAQLRRTAGPLYALRGSSTPFACTV